MRLLILKVNYLFQSKNTAKQPLRFAFTRFFAALTF